MKNVIITLVVGFVLFEFVEHVVFPLFWSIKNRKKRSVSGVTGMLGRVGKVKQWEKTEGQVFVNGELWRAVSEVPLLRGDKAVIQNVEGLTLRVKPFND
jgi:membrane-bound serine protease (ClpP class)